MLLTLDQQEGNQTTTKRFQMVKASFSHNCSLGYRLFSHPIVSLKKIKTHPDKTLYNM